MTLRPLLLVPALVLSLAGCGGGEEVDPKGAYVAQANEVCEQAKDDFASLARPTTPEGFGPFADSTVEIIDEAQQGLAALTPPEPDRVELEARVLDPFEALVVEARAFAEQVKAAGSDQNVLLPLLSARPTTGDIDLDYLRSYGLQPCADAITLT